MDNEDEPPKCSCKTINTMVFIFRRDLKLFFFNSDDRRPVLARGP